MWMPESCALIHATVGSGSAPGSAEQGVDHGTDALFDPVDRSGGRAGGATEAMVVQQRAGVGRFRVAISGIGQRVDEIDQGLDGETDFGVVPRRDVHEWERIRLRPCKVLNEV